MKLIEAEKAKDVIHEYFKSLMAKDASGTDVYKFAVGIVSCLEHDANLLKAIDELPSAEPDATTHDSIPAETGKNNGDRTSGDCISRQRAIYEIHGDADWLAAQGSDWQTERMERDKSILMSLPSVQPERSTGEWIQKPRYEDDEYPDAQPNLKCPFCGYEIGWCDMGNYCARCGADLKGKTNE